MTPAPQGETVVVEGRDTWKKRILGVIFSAIFAICTGLIGYTVAPKYFHMQTFIEVPPFGSYKLFVIVSSIAFAVLGALVGVLLGSTLYRRIVKIGQGLKRFPAEDKIACTLGTLLSLVPAIILGLILMRLNFNHIARFASVMLEAVLIVWFGNVFALSLKDELKFIFPQAARNNSQEREPSLTMKLLDTNIIIDGRIYDIARSGFLEGALVLPGFVLEELQHIADSPDALRRNRGRRGLDILQQMQNEADIHLIMMDRYSASFAPSDGVDMKLVKLAKAIGNAVLVTNDFNLNKVARLQGVRVLNINELANAVKPVVHAGEELQISIVREGKEYNQGVGYLDDGTMVVVENGKKMLGDTVNVTVSSVLQTVAGKMIFAELKYNERNQEDTLRAHR